MQQRVTNRFAGIILKDAAVGRSSERALRRGDPQHRAAFLEAGQAELKNEEHKFPKEYQPIVDEVAKSLIGSVKKGQLDAAVALVGPNNDSKFTVVGGFSLDNAPAVEKAARELVKGRDFAKVVQLDAEKAGAVSIHKVDLLSIFPERERGNLAKVFGENAPGYVAFAEDAVFAAVGPESLARIKAALEAKPGPAPFLDVVGNMKRLQAMVAAAGGEREAAEFAKMMGTDDKTASMVRITAEGGAKLSVKLMVNVRYLPKMLMSARGVAGAAPPAGRLSKSARQIDTNYPCAPHPRVAADAPILTSTNYMARPPCAASARTPVRCADLPLHSPVTAADEDLDDRGKVTYNGKPPKTAASPFTSRTKPWGQVADGTFRVERVPVGTVKSPSPLRPNPDQMASLRPPFTLEVKGQSARTPDQD